MPKPAIVFIGFMGAGKSTALRSAAPFVADARDLDDVFTAREGIPVREYFDTHGEDRFREIEREVALALLADPQVEAIALGGGSAMQEDIQVALRDHTVVHLEVKAESAWGRVSKSDRPLVQKGRESFDRLLGERRPVYERLADVVIPDGRPEQVAEAMPAILSLASLPAGTKMLWASSASASYPIFVGRGLLGSPGWWPREGRRFGIADATTAPLYGDRLPPLEKLVEVAAGESSKTLAEAERILTTLALAGATRSDHVVALGGGVVGDLGGFCAHVYQRGVPVVQVPTTLVAQVDSAYGGKTGVDLEMAKNYVGAYHQPAAVVADLDTLASLPPAELAAGFVEALKTGLLAGGDLWERVRSIEILEATELADVVFACARYKCDVVAADERDSGLRQVLNLGHTVGHAIETVSAYRLRHGEAIGLGLLAALRLSGAPELRDEVEAILRRHGLPTSLEPGVSADEVVATLGFDKKRTAAGVGFVLLAEPGQPRTGQLVPADEVRAAVEELYG